MDLMSVTATYAELEKKYNGFVSPELEIQVGSRKLISGEKLQIGELELELTNGFEASGCTFLVIGAYEPKLTARQTSCSWARPWRYPWDMYVWSRCLKDTLTGSNTGTVQMAAALIFMWNAWI